MDFNEQANSSLFTFIPTLLISAVLYYLFSATNDIFQIIFAAVFLILTISLPLGLFAGAEQFGGGEGLATKIFGILILEMALLFYSLVIYMILSIFISIGFPVVYLLYIVLLKFINLFMSRSKKPIELWLKIIIAYVLIFFVFAAILIHYFEDNPLLNAIFPVVMVTYVVLLGSPSITQLDGYYKMKIQKKGPKHKSLKNKP